MWLSVYVYVCLIQIGTSVNEILQTKTAFNPNRNPSQKAGKNKIKVYYYTLLLSLQPRQAPYSSLEGLLKMHEKGHLRMLVISTH